LSTSTWLVGREKDRKQATKCLYETAYIKDNLFQVKSQPHEHVVKQSTQ